MDIRTVHSADLSPAEREEVLALCRAAYGEDLADYYAAVAPGVHTLGRVDGRLVAQLLLVPRSLQPEGHPPLSTAYVELVATHPTMQRRGYASALLRTLPAQMEGLQLGGLSPFDDGFYARLGWERWTGPLAVRTERGLVPTPDEELMVLRLPRSPRTLDTSRGISIEWRPGVVW